MSPVFWIKRSLSGVSFSYDSVKHDTLEDEKILLVSHLEVM